MARHPPVGGGITLIAALLPSRSLFPAIICLPSLLSVRAAAAAVEASPLIVMLLPLPGLPGLSPVPPHRGAGLSERASSLGRASNSNRSTGRLKSWCGAVAALNFQGSRGRHCILGGWPRTARHSWCAIGPERQLGQAWQYLHSSREVRSSHRRENSKRALNGPWDDARLIGGVGGPAQHARWTFLSDSGS